MLCAHITTNPNKLDTFYTLYYQVMLKNNMTLCIKLKTDLTTRYIINECYRIFFLA